MRLLQLSNNFSAGSISKIFFFRGSQLQRRIFEKLCLLEAESGITLEVENGLHWR